MKPFRIVVTLLLSVVLCGKVSAQSHSMSGRDFWVIISPSLGGYELISDSLVFYIIGDTVASGTVDNEHLGFHHDFQVVPGQVTLLKIPLSEVVFDYPDINTPHCYSYNVCSSYRGVRVRSTHNIVLYMQIYCSIPDSTHTIGGLWGGANTPQYGSHYLSPLLTNTFFSEKNPVPPIPAQERVRFPDFSEEWWFDHCDETPMYTYYGFNSCRFITALEDSTKVTYSVYTQHPPLTVFTDSIMLHKEQTVFLKDSQANRHFRVETNCKPVTHTVGFQIAGAENIFMLCLPVGSFHPLTNPDGPKGYDYLCKKLNNDRFDKGIHYLKFLDCYAGPESVWSDNVDRFMYNELVSGADFEQFSLQYFAGGVFDYYDYKHAVRACSALTGSHIGYWGSASTYVSVPYTFLRSETPILPNKLNGPYYYFGKEGGPPYPIYGVQFDSVSYFAIIRSSINSTAQPTDRMVKDWVYPTTRNNVKRKIYFDDTESLEIDTLYVDVQIYVHENGLNTTYFNGQLLPAEVFDLFPMTNGDYYVTQMAFYNEDIPEIIRISNVNGFSAYVDEFGYNVLPAPGGHPEVNDITKVYYDHHGASGCFYTDYPDNGIGLSPHNFDTVYRCLGDTLSLLVEHNPDSVPVEWIVDGVSHLGDAYSFLLATLDTLTVQCVLHYDCPDTTTTFVAVVPPPLITIAHDTTVCHGATLSVEQPDALSYLWSNGATTPSITVDSAGTFQVSVTNIGCRAESDNFYVSLYGQSSVDFGDDSILCELATLLLDATQQHPAQYLWQDASTNTTYTVYEDGEYWVVVTDNCLGASDTINIGYLNDFTVNLGPDTMLCEGKVLTLNAETPYCNYLWQDGSTQPTYIVRGPGVYSVEVSNKCFSHWDAVNIDYEHCAQELYLPNAFTPGADALNPVFLPVFSYPDEIEEYRMEIYNRWGTLVFRTEEKTFGWDGTNAPDGVYAVIVHYKSHGAKAKTVTGSVTVVR